VLHARREPTFIEKHADESLVSRDLRQDPFDDEQALETGDSALPRQVDFRHPAGRQEPQQLVLSEAS
jgi:hypothetical protein